tara:strand:+ start:1086 stop:1370 length:285 start_codon:yes stop_codon:yes gene_type:complete
LKHILHELEAVILSVVTSDEEPQKSEIENPRTIPFVLDGRMIPVNPEAMGLEVKNYAEHYINGVAVKATYQLRKDDGEWSPQITVHLVDEKSAA